MQYKGLEIKVGLVIFISMVMLVALLMVVSGKGLFKNTYEVRVRFTLTDGLEDNAPVRFAGVEVGKVTGIRFIPEREAQEKDMARVEVILRVDNGLMLHNDCKIRLGALGLMGGKFVSISPGTVASPVVKPGDVLRGEDPYEMTELMAEGRDVLANLKNITTDLSDIVGSNKGNIDETIVNMRNISTSLSENLETILTRLENLLNNADEMLASNREDIREIVKNLRDTTKDAKEFAGKINEKPNALIWGYREKRAKERRRE